MEQENWANIFDWEIIAFEVIALNTCSYGERVLIIGVSTLRTSLKISDSTISGVFELIFFQSDKKIWQKYRREELRSVSDPLTCWLSITVLKRGFLRI